MSGEQDPHSSAPCWTVDLQPVLRIVCETVDVFYWSLSSIPATAEGHKQEHTLDTEGCLVQNSRAYLQAFPHPEILERVAICVDVT